jgi:hypothetical protein
MDSPEQQLDLSRFQIRSDAFERIDGDGNWDLGAEVEDELAFERAAAERVRELAGRYGPVEETSPLGPSPLDVEVAAGGFDVAAAREAITALAQRYTVRAAPGVLAPAACTRTRGVIRRRRVAPPRRPGCRRRVASSASRSAGGGADGEGEGEPAEGRQPAQHLAGPSAAKATPADAALSPTARSSDEFWQRIHAAVEQREAEQRAAVVG